MNSSKIEAFLDQASCGYRDAIGLPANRANAERCRRAADDMYECMRQRRVWAMERLRAKGLTVDVFSPVQDRLDRVAIHCVDAIGDRKTSPDARRKLANFQYGCMNQEVTIVERTSTRGVNEIDKVIRFLAKANEFLNELS